MSVETGRSGGRVMGGCVEYRGLRRVYGDDQRE